MTESIRPIPSSTFSRAERRPLQRFAVELLKKPPSPLSDEAIKDFRDLIGEAFMKDHNGMALNSVPFNQRDVDDFLIYLPRHIPKEEPAFSNILNDPSLSLRAELEREREGVFRRLKSMVPLCREFFDETAFLVLGPDFSVIPMDNGGYKPGVDYPGLNAGYYRVASVAVLPPAGLFTVDHYFIAEQDPDSGTGWVVQRGGPGSDSSFHC